MKNEFFTTNEEYYKKRIKRFGFTPNTLGYKMKADAFKIYKEATENLTFNSVLDIGAGLGYFNEWLKKEDKEYIGIEAIKEFVDVNTIKGNKCLNLTFTDKKIGTLLGTDVAILIHCCDIFIRKRLYTTKLMLEGALKHSPIVVWICYIQEGNYREREGIYKYSIHTLFEMLNGFTSSFEITVFNREQCKIVLKDN